VLPIAAEDRGLDEAGLPEENMWLGFSRCIFENIAYQMM